MTYIAAYLLGVISFGVFMLAKMRHRTPPPVLRRRNRDRLHEVRTVGGYQPLAHTRMDPPPMPVCKPARVDEVAVFDMSILE